MKVQSCLKMACLLLLITPAAWAQSLGTTNLLEGPTAGSDSVVLAASNSWTATANDTWLHLSAANQSGAGSANVIFTFDVNAGATRTGTLTIAGQTLTVTQAGSIYIAVTNVTTLVSSGLLHPYGVAVDGMGNVYIADSGNSAIKEWVAASNTVITLVSSGLNQPCSVEVDEVGNVYIADSGNNAIKEWVAASNTVITLVSSGLNDPVGVAVDGSGNVYIADRFNSAIKEWVAASNAVITLVSSGISDPVELAVDGSYNVYIADFLDSTIKEWVAASNTIISLVSSGLIAPSGIAVDGAGNVYFADFGKKAVEKWLAASNTVVTLVSSGLSHPFGVAVDGAGNICIANYGSNTVIELPRVFVDTTGRVETAAAGNDVLSVVLPASVNLTGPFAPVSDSPWLTATGASNGMVSFAFAVNNTTLRKAHIKVFDQSITVTQLGPPNYSSLVGTTNILEGRTAGSERVSLIANGSWTATTNDFWLHLSAASQSGTGNANVIFSYDANTGVTRTGTLTIAGQTVTVTQAGVTYVAVTNVTTLASSGLSNSCGVAVDGAGNVYIADSGNSAIKEWVAASNIVTTLVSSGLSGAYHVAVDGAGNVYTANNWSSTIKEWVAASNTVITLVSSGLSQPEGVAVDGAGNVFISDAGMSAIKKWVAANNTVITLVSSFSGLSCPDGVAVDGVGNVYIADTYNFAIKEWLAATNTVITLVSSGLATTLGVAVDGSGNVYIATYDNAIKEWLAASNSVITLVSSGLSYPGDVAVDVSGNIFIADSGNNAIKELPCAFVDPSAKIESASGGSDSLPVVLPATANLTGPFAPFSNSPWLTIAGVTNGVVSFAFAANPSATNRTANLTVLGMVVPVIQSAAPVSPPSLTGLTILNNGAVQFVFTNVQGASFTVWTTTNLSWPLTNWTMLGPPDNVGPGQYQFTDPAATNDVQRFYRVTSQ